MSKYLTAINLPEDLRELQPNALPQVAKELREFIIDVVATN